MTLMQAIKKAAHFLEKNTDLSKEECKIEADYIFMHVLKICKSKLYTILDGKISETKAKKIYAILQLRLKKPLSQILNKHPFYNDQFYINDKVLIPRPETESFIDEILRQGDLLYEEKNRCVLLDAGTGSGCVGITIANERSDWQVILSDISIDAIKVAKRNISLSKNNNVSVICSDWLKPFAYDSFDIIFSNPPYISINDLQIDKSVLDNEPSIALFSTEDGFGDIKKIIRYAKKTLSRSGMLFLENGHSQSSTVKSILESEDFTDIRIHLDYNKCGRFTSSRNKNG